jgi:hypothetical protein
MVLRIKTDIIQNKKKSDGDDSTCFSIFHTTNKKADDEIRTRLLIGSLLTRIIITLAIARYRLSDLLADVV